MSSEKYQSNQSEKSDIFIQNLFPKESNKYKGFQIINKPHT